MASAGKYRFFANHDNDDDDEVMNFCIFKGRQGATTGDWGIDKGWMITDTIKDMKELDYKEISRLEALLLTGHDLEAVYENIVKRSQVT